MELKNFSDISNLLPDHFTFYDKGAVQYQPDTLAENSDRTAAFLLGQEFEHRKGVGFRIYHLDEAPSALLVFLFDGTLDESMYTEMGNILASKLCKNLGEKEKLEMMISAPILLKGSQLKRLAQGSPSGVRRSYLHSYELNGIVTSIPVETWTLPVSQLGSHLENQLGTGQIGNV